MIRNALLTLLVYLILLYQSALTPVFAANKNASDTHTTTLSASYYTAGVVEFRPADDIPNELEDNLAGYLDIINSKEATSTDIIVFPESTLNRNAPTFVPDPLNNDLESPCLTANSSVYSDFLVQLSCAARTVRKYLVINLTERAKCVQSAEDPRPCAANGLNIFNTNIVFDREGRVISRYRKWNLYGDRTNQTLQVGYGLFGTDFGVVFGHFICFDILFYQPAQHLVNLGYTDFIFPSMWFSQLPFLTGVQIQQSWAYANDVNFLAAGSSFPAVGSTGTGIYAGRNGPLVSVMNTGEGERRLYVARVPKKKSYKRARRAVRQIDEIAIRPHASAVRPSQADIFLKRDYLELYKSFVVDFEAGVDNSANYEVCYNHFCCQFEFQWHALRHSNESHYYTYRLGAYEGMRKESGADGTNALRNCAMFTCIGDDVSTCGRLLPAGVVQEPRIAFERIRIEANFQKGYPALLMPNSLRDDLKPLDVHEFEWEEYDDWNDTEIVRHVRYTLNTTTSNLLTFAIYGNFYDGEGFILRPSTLSTPITVHPNDNDGAGALLQPIVMIWTWVLLLRVAI